MKRETTKRTRRTLDAQIEHDAREECRAECGCGKWRAHVAHIRQDADTMAIYRGEETSAPID